MAGLQVLHRLHAIINDDSAALARCDDVYGREDERMVDAQNHFYSTTTSRGVVVEDTRANRDYVQIWTHLAPYVYFGYNGDPVHVLTSHQFRDWATTNSRNEKKRSSAELHDESPGIDLEIDSGDGTRLIVEAVRKDEREVHCRLSRDALGKGEKADKAVVCAALNAIQAHFHDTMMASRESRQFEILKLKPGAVFVSDDPSCGDRVCLRVAYDLARVDLSQGATIKTTCGTLGAHVLRAMEEAKKN